MNKEPVTKASTEADDLPQIRFPAESSMHMADPASEHDDIEKLSKIVEGTFNAIASATGLSDKEVLRIIKDTDVEMLKDVLKDGANVDELKEGIQESIKKISLATALDTAQISGIFTAKKDADLHDIVMRLYDRAQTNRGNFGN